MNQIEIRKIQKTENWIDFEWFIDGVRLSQYLYKNKKIELPDIVEPFEDLCPAWTKELNYFGDVRFVWNLLQREKTVLPIYVCPDDLDFSCIVMVADVEKTSDFVYWRRIGYVSWKDYDFSVEKKRGILYVEAYSDDDWERYGDNIALTDVDSEEWCQWIGENWEEELFRRRMNYTLPAYMDDKNIIWFADLDFTFGRNQYERMVNTCWEEETLDELSNYDGKEMTFERCVDFIKRITRNGSLNYKEHKDTFGKVLLHVFASEEIGNPLYQLLEKDSDSKYTAIYSKLIELMWRFGDDAVKNVVDVTLLERLSDDPFVWKRFGRYLSDEFKKYINEDLLCHNIAMCAVIPLE